MTLIDAIKSGRPCPFCGTTEKLSLQAFPGCKATKTVYCDRCGAWGPGASADPVRAVEFWNERVEIQEPTVTITRTQFWEAAEAVKVTVRDSEGYKEVSLREYLEWPITGSRHLGELANKLGLGEK